MSWEHNIRTVSVQASCEGEDLYCKTIGNNDICFYRGVIKGLFVLLSRTQAGPGRTVKQEQEEISRNHVQTFISPSVNARAFSTVLYAD